MWFNADVIVTGLVLAAASFLALILFQPGPVMAALIGIFDVVFMRAVVAQHEAHERKKTEMCQRVVDAFQTAGPGLFFRDSPFTPPEQTRQGDLMEETITTSPSPKKNKNAAI